MKRLARPLIMVAAALSLVACLEGKQSVTINPDGSGKMLVDSLLEVPAGEKSDAVSVARKMATALVTQTTGVDAWKDMTLEAAADGRAHLAATAYFPDISRLKMALAVPMTWTKDERGNFTLMIKGPAAAPKEKPNFTDKEVADRIAKAKAQLKQSQPTAQFLFSGLKMNMTFSLPGQVSDTNILVKGADGQSATLAFDGKKLLDAIDKVIADDKALEESIRSGKGEQDDDLVLVKIYGKKGPISATVTGPGKPLFDYKTEMEAAKAGEAEMFKKLAIDTTPQIPLRPMEGEPPAAR